MVSRRRCLPPDTVTTAPLSATANEPRMVNSTGQSPRSCRTLDSRSITRAARLRFDTAMAAVLVDLDQVSAARPGRPLFTDLSVTVHAGDRLGLVGLNGTGKSTLLRVMAGVDIRGGHGSEPEAGTVRRGRGVRIGFLE